VITLPTAEYLVPTGLPDFHLVLPRQLERSFDRLRAAAGEIHTTAGKILARELKQLRRILFRYGSGELAAVTVFEITP